MEQASRRRGVLIGAIALTAFIAAVALAFLWTGDDSDDEGNPPEVVVGEPTLVSEEQLKSFAETHQRPLYWAGARAGTRYELTRIGDDRVFIRYLPEGAEAGDPRPRFLTVATYAQANAYAFLRTQSRREGWTGQRTRSGALVAYSESRPTSVYFAFPDADLQVEVYDPVLGEARTLVLAGDIRELR